MIYNLFISKLSTWFLTKILSWSTVVKIFWTEVKTVDRDRWRRWRLLVEARLVRVTTELRLVAMVAVGRCRVGGVVEEVWGLVEEVRIGHFRPNFFSTFFAKKWDKIFGPRWRRSLISDLSRDRLIRKIRQVERFIFTEQGCEGSNPVTPPPDPQPPTPKCLSTFSHRALWPCNSYTYRTSQSYPTPIF